jgi:1-hydroxycarotenoid 3,4-desaturase
MTVIVGGGLGGLAAAACLAGRGREVTVVEAGPRLGGKADAVTVDGVAFDTGPSVFTLPEVADGVFRDAGTSLRDQVTLRPVEVARMRFPTSQVDLYHGAEGAVQGVADALGGHAARELRAYLAYSRRIWEAVAPTFVLGEAPTPWSVVQQGPGALRDLWRADPLRSMQVAIDAHVEDPRLRAILARFATYNGSDPRRAPATLNCIAWVELGLGAYGVEGGIRALVEALVRVGRAGGVVYRTDTRVEAITTSGDAVSGVQLAGGEHLPARAVVCNADAQHLADDLLPGAVRVAPERSTSGWTAVVRTPRQERPAHEVLFAMPYVREFQDLFDHQRAPQEPTVYVCAQEVAHGRTGWAYDEAVFAMTNAPAGCDDVTASRARALERLVDAGVIAPEADVVWERTPRGLADRFPGSAGSLYGAASNSRTAAFQRPANRTRVAGLYIASGSAHPGGGVPMVMQSGRMAAGLLLQDQP